jgi:hypothetical protein
MWIDYTLLILADCRAVGNRVGDLGLDDLCAPPGIPHFGAKVGGLCALAGAPKRVFLGIWIDLTEVMRS